MVWERKVRSRKRYEVRLIIRSPGLAYALNDFLEVLSHLQREYEETRTTKKVKKHQDGRKKSFKSQMSQWFVDGSRGQLHLWIFSENNHQSFWVGDPNLFEAFFRWAKWSDPCFPNEFRMNLQLLAAERIHETNGIFTYSFTTKFNQK